MNTDLSRFRFKEENYECYAVESDLIEYHLVQPGFLAPCALVILSDGIRRWVLKRGFAPKFDYNEDGAFVKVTANEQAEELVRRINLKGRVDLTLWATWDSIFTHPSQPTQSRI